MPLQNVTASATAIEHIDFFPKSALEILASPLADSRRMSLVSGVSEASGARSLSSGPVPDSVRESDINDYASRQLHSANPQRPAMVFVDN